MSEQLLKAPQVAKRLHISLQSLWVYRAQGFMPLPIKLRGTVRWLESDIDKWILARCPVCRMHEQRERGMRA